jgi:hypothetical protein
MKIMKNSKYYLFFLPIICIGALSGLIIYPHISESKSFGGSCAINAQKKAFDSYINVLYSDLHVDTAGLRMDVFKKGITGYFNLRKEGKVTKQVISIIDFRMSSTEKRLWVIDLEKKKLLFHSLVAHGKNSGEAMAQGFSNLQGSSMSSIGFYTTSEIYDGVHGESLKLDGVDPGYNDNARERAIVIHAADYVSEGFIKNAGRLGRSNGCPALPNGKCKAIICSICSKSCLFIFSGDKEYETKTQWLKEAGAIAQYTKEYPVQCMVQ